MSFEKKYEGITDPLWIQKKIESLYEDIAEINFYDDPASCLDSPCDELRVAENRLAEIVNSNWTANEFRKEVESYITGLIIDDAGYLPDEHTRERINVLVDIKEKMKSMMSGK